MTEAINPGHSEDKHSTFELPRHVAITELVAVQDLTERLRVYELNTRGTAGIFVFRGRDAGFDVDTGLNTTLKPTAEMRSLFNEVHVTGKGKHRHGTDGQLILAFPIWLKSDGRSYLKGCFAACCEANTDEQLEANLSLAQFVADSLTDRISLNYGGRVAHSEYDALHKELDLGNRLISLLESLGTGMVVLDHDLRVVWANSIIAKRKVAYQVGQYCYQAIPTDEPCTPCAARQALTTGQSQIGIPGRRPDGTIYTRTSTMPVIAADGTVSHVLILITDINEPDQEYTERINYKRLVDTSDDFMMICDARGISLAVNRRIVDVLGYSEGELLDQHPVGIVSTTDIEKFHTATQTSAQLGVAMDAVTLRAKDGTHIPTQMVMAFDRDRNVYEIIFRDISERLRMEAELSARSEELQEQNRRVISVANERDRFFRSVSHELRTPLTSVIGFAELLLEDTDEPLSERQRQLMMRVVGNSHKLLAMVSDLLDFSKIEAGRMEVHLGTVRLDELVTHIVGNLAPLAKSKNLLLNVKRNGKLPVVHTDEQKLSQILVNLLSNAIKFTEEGSVEVSAKADKKWFSISVTDTGTGIAEGECEAIFREFYQAQGSKSKERGSGLGLAISQRMASLLGGSITVESKLGVGSTFTVTLPIAAIGEHPAKS